MKCDNCLDKLSSLMDGELSEEETKEVEHHIATCQKCRETYAMYKAIQEEISNIENIRLPETFHNELMKRIEGEAKQKKKTSFGKMKWMSYMGTTAAAVLILAVGINQLQPKSEDTAPMPELSSPQVTRDMPQQDGMPAPLKSMPEVADLQEEVTHYAIQVNEVWEVENTKELKWVVEEAKKQQGIIVETLTEDEILLHFEDEEIKKSFVTNIQKHIMIEKVDATESLSVQVHVITP